jgi:hypothetical protein
MQTAQNFELDLLLGTGQFLKRGYETQGNLASYRSAVSRSASAVSG